MPSNLFGRTMVILAVTLIALWALFPTAPKALLSPFMDVEYTLRPNLRPGIDMVGGTSLTYEIRAPQGAFDTDNLAAEVAAILKRRVDPQGVRNLIWRPQGNTRLEIQMPLTRRSGQASAARQQFSEAQRILERTNVRPGQVLAAIQTFQGEQRLQRLEELAGGSPQRLELFREMAQVWDGIQQARAQQDAATQARLELRFDELRNQVADLNLSPYELQSILELSPQARQTRLQELRQRFADFPQRLQAIDHFVESFDHFAQFRDEIEDAVELKRLLRGSGVLEFYILATDVPQQQFEEMRRRLLERGPRMQPGDTLRWLEVARPDEPLGVPLVEYNERFYALVYTDPGRSLQHREGAQQWALQRAEKLLDQGQRKVGFRFDAVGARLFADLTGNNIGRPLAIVLDGRIISAPVIRSQIMGSGEISGGRGGFSVAEQNYLVSTLNAGSLPAQLTDEPIMERTVGPQLGEDNLRAGFIACILGLVVVAIFMIGYYYIKGAVAMIAVLLNLLLIMGGMAALNATFTLPAVAGIVLTIGMSVDANVLIFERFREELRRGLSLRAALAKGYDKAFSAILDGNLTTAITSAFLFLFGSEEVRGFGIALLIGLVSSMFTALYVTKTIFAFLIDRMGVEHLGSIPTTFPKWDQLLNPKIDWIGKAKYFIAFSAVVIAVGLTMFVIRLNQGRVLDIEFTSGTAVEFDLLPEHAMPIAEVRRIVDAYSAQNPDALPSPMVVTVGDTRRTYEIVTPSSDTATVRQAILQAFQGKLDVAEPSRFDGVDAPIHQVLNDVVFPITATTTSIAGFTDDRILANTGGVAVWLRNLDPPLTAEQISSRLDQQRLQLSGDRRLDRPFEVIGGPGDESALVLYSDLNIGYQVDDPVQAEQWLQFVAAPVWQVINEAINRPAELNRVLSLDPQIAAEAQRDAIIALTLSLAGIVAYVWLRFGNLRYGMGTIIALIHDTAFVIAAVGFAHYLAEIEFFARWLLIEPFRFNLTLLAALLTVIGYSMNDTVVVFDRVRENRGKFGHLSRRVVNTSINETLSRTLLTGMTTLMCILVMYIWGGAGIHGFTFALLVGILVGTYSSIAIASPLVLIGVKPQPYESTGAPTTVGQGQLQKA